MSKLIKKTSPVVKTILKKITSFSTTGIIPYLLILIVLVGVGVFGMARMVNAQTPGPESGICYQKSDHAVVPFVPGIGSTYKKQCDLNPTIYEWIPIGSTTPSAPISTYQNCLDEGGTPEGCKLLSGAPASGATASKNQTDFEIQINRKTCGFGVAFLGGEGSSIYPGCVLQVFYGLFYVVPAYFLAQTA